MKEEVPEDPSVLVNTINKALEKIFLRGNLSSDTLNNSLDEDPKFAWFYVSPKIYKRLDNVTGRPVIPNCSFYTENISLFLDYHLQPLAHKVKSYIKDTNHFLNKIKKLVSLFFFFTLMNHMGKTLRLTVRFCKLGITNKSQVILCQKLWNSFEK